MIDEPGPWGTGPFELKEGVSVLDKRSPEVVMVPNKAHWNKARVPKATIIFDNIVSKGEALDLVMNQTGKVDIVTELTPAEAKQVAGSKNARLVESKSKTLLVGVFNQNAPGSKWKDEKLRQALNLAVDRNAVVKDAALGYGTVMPSMIMPTHFGADPSLKPYGYDPAAAKKSLAAAGVTTITIVAGEGHKAVADAIGKSLAASGVTVKTELTGAPKGDNWDLWLVEHFDWSPEYPYGVVFREFFGKDGGFRKMPEDSKFTAMGAEMMKTTDKAKQEALTKQMDRHVHDTAPVLFLYAPSKLYAVSNRVNFTPYKTWMFEPAEASRK